jgi:pimeloyl-ACP methyl ester carboxylesterase
LIIIQAPKKTQEELDYLQNIFLPELQADHATKSSQGKLIVAENSGHMIPNEQPEIIIEAVREMIDELRNAKE